MEHLLRKEMSNVGKNHEEEIEKICMDMNKLIHKADHTPTEVDCIHDYAEVIYYLTVTDAMNKAKEDGGFSMAMDGRSMRMTPIYDYSMGEPYVRGGSYDGRMGRDNDNDGRYSERRGGGSMGHMPREVYDGESERYYGRY
jgi:hypothetical protein